MSDADRKPVPGGGKKKHKGGDTRTPEDQIPTWEKPDAKVLERAARKSLPLLILFEGEDDESTEADYMRGKEVVELAKTKGIFIRIKYNPDREESWDDGSMVPTSILLSKNPSRDYHIKTYPTMIIADCHGNEYFKGTAMPTVQQVTKWFESVADLQKKSNERLQKKLDEAKKAFEAKDAAKTLKALSENFATKIVGLEAQEASIKLYHQLIEGGRKEMQEAIAAGGKTLEKKLKEMKKTYKDTELIKELDAALKDLK